MTDLIVSRASLMVLTNALQDERYWRAQGCAYWASGKRDCALQAFELETEYAVKASEVLQSMLRERVLVALPIPANDNQWRVS